MLAFYSLPVKVDLAPLSLKEARQQDTEMGEPAAEEVYIGREKRGHSHWRVKNSSIAL